MHALKVGIIHWWQNPLTLGTATWWSPASQRALQMSLGPTNRRNEGGAFSKAAHTNAVQGAYIRTHYMLCKVRTYVHITCCASVDTSWQTAKSYPWWWQDDREKWSMWIPQGQWFFHSAKTRCMLHQHRWLYEQQVSYEIRTWLTYKHFSIMYQNWHNSA